ncbi:hypothetical protein VSS74_05785 [Conexibacter stalactiti]|uniref:WD40 repeat protein n=1 Tax=Conexibacter stalactiti TaxID=1940611 RepID=A0ABU4HM92_9ACTN|nr:hypothetical protein [Conexibacter stalactiti]MDW5593834.1 hypothetical protein [Conexibacter stalactiti]MEC5034476.1 hypothetical protein [Conexibacter stalactiti]
MRKSNANRGRRGRLATALAATACAGTLASGLPAAAGAEGLPNGRAYEMVTPIEKGGFDITAWTFGGWMVGGSDGERIDYGLYGGIEGGSSSTLGTALLQAKRTPAGWTSSGVLPRLQPGVPYLVGFGQGSVIAETPDLRTVVGSSTQPERPGAIAGKHNLFARDLDGGFSLLAPGSVPYSSFDTPDVPGLSDDGRHIAFESDLQLTPDAQAGVINLYESVDGVVRLAGILPDGSVPAAGTSGAGRAFQRPVSADGSRIFFLDRGTGELYVRIDGQQTIRVSRPYENSEVDRGVAGRASTVYATPDGSKVAFISSGRLTPGAPANDAYLFDVETQRLTNLTATAGHAAAITAVVGLSDDGETVYLNALQLTNSAPVAPTGRSLYVWRAGTVRWISSVRTAQSERPERMSSFVSPGGRLVFHTPATLPGYPMTGANINASRWRVFLYDPAGAGQVRCLSCLPDGRADLVDSSAGSINEGIAKIYPNRRMQGISDDGRRVWFETISALVPEDQNGRLDVYQWEEGELSLISTGRSPADSYLGDASDSGDDVFFYTREQLVPEDTDTLLDVYDARVGGGLPSRVPPQRDRTCPAAGCQGDPAPRPVDREAGSVTDPSDGNAADPIAPADPVPFELIVAKADREARARLGKRGTLALRVDANRATKIAATLRVRSGGRWVAAGSKTVTLRRAGSTTVRLTLSKRARGQLTRARRLTVRVEVRAGGLVRQQQLTVAAPRRAKGTSNG